MTHSKTRQVSPIGLHHRSPREQVVCSATLGMRVVKQEKSKHLPHALETPVSNEYEHGIPNRHVAKPRSIPRKGITSAAR